MQRDKSLVSAKMRGSMASLHPNGSALLADDSRGIIELQNLDETELKTLNNQNIQSNVCSGSIMMRPAGSSAIMKSSDFKKNDIIKKDDDDDDAVFDDLLGPMVPAGADQGEQIRQENLQYIQDAHEFIKKEHEALDNIGDDEILKPYMNLIQGENLDLEALRKRLMREA